MPPLVLGISDLHLSLILPIMVHWLTSGCFEICDRAGWLSQYRLHTSAEELKRNRVTRRECLRVTLQCQILQTLLGLVLGALGEGDVTGSEDYDVAIWITRVRAVFEAIPSFLSVTGLDFKTMAITLSRPRPFVSIVGYPEFGTSGIEELIGKAIYWYIVPIFQLASALITADASMYCLHRLGHTNKWMYRTDAGFHDVHHQSWGLKTNFGAHLTIWDRMMGTYFADEEEITRLRRKNRIAAE
ncbi:hypothetical protein B7463_g1945, partial [Scytalidium lignicola]